MRHDSVPGVVLRYHRDSHEDKGEKRVVAISGKYCSCGLKGYMMQNITFKVGE